MMNTTITDCQQQADAHFEETRLMFVPEGGPRTAFYGHLCGAFLDASLLAWKAGLPFTEGKDLPELVTLACGVRIWTYHTVRATGEQRLGRFLRDLPRSPGKGYFGRSGPSAMETALAFVREVRSGADLAGMGAELSVWPGPDARVLRWHEQLVQRLAGMIPPAWTTHDFKEETAFMLACMKDEHLRWSSVGEIVGQSQATAPKRPPGRKPKYSEQVLKLAEKMYHAQREKLNDTRAAWSVVADMYDFPSGEAARTRVTRWKRGRNGLRPFRPAEKS